MRNIIPYKKRFGTKKETIFRSGWFTVGGNKCYFRSSWEYRWSLYLEWLKRNKQIREWRYEPTTFWFEKIKRGVRSYKPDFEVTENNGSVRFEEIKGYLDAKSRTKLKRMRIYHPQVKIILIDSKTYKTIMKQMGNLIHEPVQLRDCQET